MLQDLKPDIANLCEVEGCDEMFWLAETLNAGEEEEGLGAYYNAFLLKGQDTFTVGGLGQ